MERIEVAGISFPESVDIRIFCLIIGKQCQVGGCVFSGLKRGSDGGTIGVCLLREYLMVKTGIINECREADRPHKRES